MSKQRHPLQPIVRDERGVVRFRANPIVRWLVDQLPGGLNTIAIQRFDAVDREQLAMLIGYSVSGAGDPLVHERRVHGGQADAAKAQLHEAERASRQVP